MERFTINSDGTVTDTETGLMWDRETHGPMTWEEAIEFCRILATADYNDWRLPALSELMSLIDHNNSPIIDKIAFPDTRLWGYWSSSTYAHNPEDAWLVHFYGGHAYNYDDKAYDHYVRAVRNGG